MEIEHAHVQGAAPTPDGKIYKVIQEAAQHTTARTRSLSSRLYISSFSVLYFSTLSSTLLSFLSRVLRSSYRQQHKDKRSAHATWERRNECKGACRGVPRQGRLRSAHTGDCVPSPAHPPAQQPAGAAALCTRPSDPGMRSHRSPCWHAHCAAPCFGRSAPPFVRPDLLQQPPAGPHTPAGGTHTVGRCEGSTPIPSKGCGTHSFEAAG
jgi:hypothetical protein